MTLTDDDHEAARIIKELEKRVADLEEQSRSQQTPNLLVTETDRPTIGDRIQSVEQKTMETGTWGNAGYRTTSWGSYDWQ